MMTKKEVADKVHELLSFALQRHPNGKMRDMDVEVIVEDDDVGIGVTFDNGVGDGDYEEWFLKVEDL